LIGAGLIYAITFLAPCCAIYADESARAIVACDTKDDLLAELLKRGSPEFRKQTSKEDFDQISAGFAKLGKFKSYDGIKQNGKFTIHYDDGAFGVTGTYNAAAVFEHGVLDLKLTIVRHKSEWQIQGLDFQVKMYSSQNTPGQE
jgi:hypothetical protein